MEFSEKQDVVAYLNEHFHKGVEYSDKQVAAICFPVFMSPLLYDSDVMMYISQLVSYRTGREMFRAISSTIDLTEETLTLAQFHGLCHIRGPITLENFEFEVVKKINIPVIQVWAKHKDFPAHLKTEFFNIIGDTEYLPKEAQDIFVF